MESIPLLEMKYHQETKYHQDDSVLDAMHKAFTEIGFTFVKHPLITQQDVSQLYTCKPHPLHSMFIYYIGVPSSSIIICTNNMVTI